MRGAAAILEIIQERGRKGLPLERVYRLLFNRELFLTAYGKLYRNDGALTPGSTPETVDEMSIARIDAIIEALRFERYRWTPTRRVYIEKKNSTKKRPLSMPTWSDKLLQEVIRLILERYYEPTMSPASHGRSEEHTSELQSRLHLVCRLLLAKKKMTATETAVKWRFLDEEKSGFGVSVVPPILLNIQSSSVRRGLAEHGTRVPIAIRLPNTF